MRIFLTNFLFIGQTKPYTAKAKPYIQPVVPYIEKAKPYAPSLAAGIAILAAIPFVLTLLVLAMITSPVCTDQIVEMNHFWFPLPLGWHLNARGLTLLFTGVGILCTDHFIYLGAPRHLRNYRVRLHFRYRRFRRDHPLLH